MKNRILKYILVIILSILVLGGFVGNYFDTNIKKFFCNLQWLKILTNVVGGV